MLEKTLCATLLAWSASAKETVMEVAINAARKRAGDFARVVGDELDVSYPGKVFRSLEKRKQSRQVVLQERQEWICPCTFHPRASRPV